MTDDLTILKVGKVLKQIRRPEVIVPTRKYKVLGAHWYARGLYVKETKQGSEIKADTLFRVEQGDFVYNRLFAWKGSFALATEHDHGCYVSNEFPCFQIDRSVIDPKYLSYFFARESSWNKALGLSSGGTPTSRNRLKEEKFLGMELPRLSLTDQERMVSRVDELTSCIREALSRQAELANEATCLCRSILLNDESAKRTPMRELVQLREPDVIVHPEELYQFAGVYCFGKGVFKGQMKAGIEFAYARLTRLRSGNFVYPKLMAWEGALGVVPQECDGCVVSTEFPVFDVFEDKVFPEVLDVYFRDPAVWPELSGASTGTNVRRRRLNPSDFLDYKLPLPTPAVQRRLRRVLDQVKILFALQRETKEELEGLLPSVLSNAFAGTL